MLYPKITIGLTCYNAKNSISKALNSALSQKWKNFEIVVVDDASSDGSGEIIKLFSEEHDNIRVFFHEKNEGCAAARNTIVRNSDGEFICFFDDDDESDPNRIASQLSTITRLEKSLNTTQILCFCSRERMYPNGYKVLLRAIGSQGQIPVGVDVAKYLLFNKRMEGLFYGSGTPTCALMARRESFEHIGEFDTSFLRQEDIDFSVRAAFNNYHFVGTKEVLVKQFASGGLDKSALIEFSSSINLLKKNMFFLKENGVYAYMVCWTRLRYFHFSGKKLKTLFQLILLITSHPLLSVPHLLKSGISRLKHERRINGSQKQK